MIKKFALLLDLARRIASLPEVHLEFQVLRDPGNVERIYRHFIKRHPRYYVIRNKTVGAALVDLTRFKTRADYLETVKGRNSAEYHARRARTRGYQVAEIDRNQFIDDIHHVNTCVEIRQGKKMDASYRIKQEHFEPQKNYKYFGILNAAGNLVAYSEVGLWGNFAAFNRVIGIRNNDGIMHLLVSEIICQLIEIGEVQYLMYDTYFGASPGLKFFKTALGFSPYRARYRLL